MWYDSPREVRRVDMGSVSEWDAATLKHPDAAGLHAMWNALRGDRPVPFRAELDAGRIGARAPFLAILEYVGPSNFRIRIAGDRLNKWFGMELRGMSALSLLDTAARNHFQATLNRVTAEPAVGVLHGAARGPEGLSLSFEMVLLPMRSDFGRVDRVLVGLWMLDAPRLMHGPLRLEPDAFTIGPIHDAAAQAVGSDALPDDDADGGTRLREPSASPLRLVDPQAPAVARSGVGKLEEDRDGTADFAPKPDDDKPNGPGRRGHLRLVKKS